MIDPVELFVSKYSDDDSDDPVASFVRKYHTEDKKPQPRRRETLTGREGRSVFRNLARTFGDRETRERITEEESRESGVHTLPTVRVEADAPPLARTRQFGKQALRGAGEAVLSTAAGAANLVGADRANEAINRQRDEMREFYGEPLGGAGMAGLLAGSLAENMAMYALAPSALAAALRGGALAAKTTGAFGAVKPLLKGEQAVRRLSAASAGAKPGLKEAAKRIGAGSVLQAPLDLAISQDEQGNTAAFLGEALDSDRMRKVAQNPVGAAATEMVLGNLVPSAAFEGARAGARAVKNSEFGQAVKEMKDDGVFQIPGLTTKDVGGRKLYHGTSAQFNPREFEIGRPSTTVPMGGGDPVPVRNMAAFFAESPADARRYGNRVIEANLAPGVKILDDPSYDWRRLENNPAEVERLKSEGYGAIRFTEGDDQYKTVAVLDKSALEWVEPKRFPDNLYSRVDRNISSAPAEKMQGRQWLAHLRKGSAQGELEWTGLKSMLEAEPDRVFTRGEVKNHFDQNKVELEVTELGGGPKVDNSAIERRIQEINDELHRAGVYVYDRNGPPEIRRLQEEMGELHQKLEEQRAATPKTKFSQYAEPGGENYKEILIRLKDPTEGVERRSADLTAEYRQLSEESGKIYSDPGAPPRMREIYEELKRLAGVVQNHKRFQSSHWDQPNVLAHIRQNDRVTPDGKKVRHVEEIQSDWHQQGRNSGYRDPEAKRQYDEINKKMDALLAEEAERVKREGLHADKYGQLKLGPNEDGMYKWPPGTIPQSEAEYIARGLRSERPEYRALLEEQDVVKQSATTDTPNAPFKKTDDWTALAWKKIIDDAVADGVDHISWAPGRVQADRYDLSKQISEVSFKKLGQNEGHPTEGLTGREKPGDYYDINVADMDGASVDGLPRLYHESDLEKYFGKELAAKIVNAGDGGELAARRYGYQRLRGLDLQVGGEGMKKFYDEVIPKSLQKYAKSLGISIDVGSVNIGKAKLRGSVWNRGTFDNPDWVVTTGPRDGTVLGEYGTNLHAAQQFLRSDPTLTDPALDRPGVPVAPFREALERSGGEQPLWSAAAAGGALAGDDEDESLRNAILFGLGGAAMMGRTAKVTRTGIPAALQDGALDATVAKISQHLAHNQGFTLAPHTGELLGKQTPGFSLGVGKQMGVKLEADELTPDALRKFVQQNRKLFAGNPNLTLGGWRNPETGKFDLEPAELVMDRRLAAREAMRRGELAIWDFANEREISTKPATFDHYSTQAGLQRLEGRYQGTGLATGREAQRPKRPPVVHVYDAGAEPEFEVASAFKVRGGGLYHVEVPEGQIYDAFTDPDGIVKRSLARKPGDTDAWEKAIREAGYDGYYNSDFHPTIKKLFDNWEVRPDSPGLVDAPPPAPDAFEYTPLRVRQAIPAGTKNVEEVAAVLAQGRKAVGEELSEQVVEAVKRGLPEVRDALEKSGGESWYKAELAMMDRALQGMIPELADPVEMKLFRVILAVTSPNQNPNGNLLAAIALYQKYLANGRQLSALSPYLGGKTDPVTGKRLRDTSVRGHVYQGNWEVHFRKLEEYLGTDRAAWGDKLEELYLERVEQKYKPQGSTEGVVENMPLAATMFGPKVGRFYSNLSGFGRDVTVDKWAVRTLRSWLGIPSAADQVSDAEGVVMRKALARLADLVSVDLKRRVDPMDVQAALWYYEQRRYRQLGARTSGEESYRHAAERIASTRSAGTPGATAKGRKPADGGAPAGADAPGAGGARGRQRGLRRGNSGLDNGKASDPTQTGKRRGAADARALGDIATAGGGAIVGSLTDDESPGRGALIGAVVGYSGGRVAPALVRLLQRDAGKLGIPAKSLPAHARAASLIDFDGSQTKGWASELRGSLKDRISRIADLMDASRPIERIGTKVENKLRPTENPKYLLSRVRAADETIRTAINQGVVDFDTREIVAPSYRQVFEPLGHNDADIRAGLLYAVSKRKLDRGLAFVGGDQNQLNDAAIVVRDLGSVPEIIEFEGRLTAYTEAIGDYAVKSGLWTPELWAKIKQSDALYLPFRRILDDFKGKGAGGIGGRLANITPGVKKVTGSKRSIENPAVALAEYTESIIRRADQYRVGHALFDAVDALGPEGEAILTRISGNEMGRKAPEIENARQALIQAGIDPAIADELAGLHIPDLSHHNPVIWRNGPNGKEYAVVQNKSLWEALGTLRPESREGIRKILDLTIRPLKRIFTAATTGLNPRFAFGTNPTRDVMQAWQQSTSGVRVTELAKAWYQAIAASNALAPLAGAVAGAGVGELAADNPLAGAVIGGGGGAAVARIGGQKMVPKGVRHVVGQASRSGLGHTALTSQDVNVNAAARRFAPTTRWHRFRSTLEQITGSPVRFAEGAVEAGDRAPRVAEYLAATRSKQHMVTQGLWTPADLRLYAATKARNATIDFSRKASSPVLRFAGDYIPFFNVAIQAPLRYSTAWKESPKRMAVASTGVALAAVAAWALKERDEDMSVQINDRPATERAAFLLLPLGGENVIRLPMGQENGLIAAAVTAGLDKLAHDDPHAARLMREAIVRALPPGFGGTVVPIPVVQQIQEVQRNRTDYGSRPVEPERMRGALPAERRLDTTSPTFDAAAALARKIPGMENTSPLQAEHVIRGVTSGFTPAITKVTDPLAEKLGFAPAKSRIPLGPGREPLNPTSAFIARTPPTTTESEQDYYGLRTTYLQVQEKKRSLESALKSADQVSAPAIVAEAQNFQAKYQGFLTPEVEELFKGADDRLKDLREDERRILEAYRRGVLDGDQAREIADKIRLERQETYRLVLPIMQRLGVPGAKARQQ
jgi:hypothetical protein